MNDLKLVNPDFPHKNSDMVDIYCYKCRVAGKKKLIQAKRTLSEKGFGYQCEGCLKSKISEAKKLTYSSEELQSLQLVDTSPRAIKTHDVVEFRCSCGNTGMKMFGEAKRGVSRHGFSFQCETCRWAKFGDTENRPEWLAKVRAAAQSDEHKARAVANGKKKISSKDLKNIEEFWDFGSESLQRAGHENILGKCKKCGTESTKPLKKFIEALFSVTKGCQECLDLYNRTDEFRNRMGNGSKGYYESLSPEKRNEIRLKKVENLLGFENSPHKGKGDNKPEKEIREFIEGLGLSTIKSIFQNSAGIVRELDIYIPELKIGIEHHGLIWHSDKFKSNEKSHYEKFMFFKEMGIRVIQIFENEWKSFNSQTKSFLRSALKKNENSYGARECDFSILDNKEDFVDVRLFLQHYHIQGSVTSVEFAIRIKSPAGDVIGLATFGRHHRGNDKLTLNRLAFKENISVAGALSKLTKMASDFAKEDIITWADARISEGNGYRQAGWEDDGWLEPDYFYTDGSKVIKKQSRQKSAVGTPEGMTEREHAKADGLYRVYDAGKFRLIYRFKPKD